MADIEAVQFTPYGPWHAVISHDTTLCGKDSLRASHMWQEWDEQTYRCQTCLRRVPVDHLEDKNG